MKLVDKIRSANPSNHDQVSPGPSPESIVSAILSGQVPGGQVPSEPARSRTLTTLVAVTAICGAAAAIALPLMTGEQSGRKDLVSAGAPPSSESGSMYQCITSQEKSTFLGGTNEGRLVHASALTVLRQRCYEVNGMANYSSSVATSPPVTLFGKPPVVPTAHDATPQKYVAQQERQGWKGVITAPWVRSLPRSAATLSARIEKELNVFPELDLTGRKFSAVSELLRTGLADKELVGVCLDTLRALPGVSVKDEQATVAVTSPTIDGQHQEVRLDLNRGQFISWKLVQDVQRDALPAGTVLDEVLFQRVWMTDAIPQLSIAQQNK